MTATTSSTALATIQPTFTDAERLALAGFLAGYRGLTREAYTLDLRQFTGWCRARSLPLFSVRRADIETFARNSRHSAAPAPRSPGGCAQLPTTPTVNVWPLRVDGWVQVAANRSGVSRGFELSGSLVRDVWADDGLWLVCARWARDTWPERADLVRRRYDRPSVAWLQPPGKRALAR